MWWNVVFGKARQEWESSDRRTRVERYSWPRWRRPSDRAARSLAYWRTLGRAGDCCRRTPFGHDSRRTGSRFVFRRCCCCCCCRRPSRTGVFCSSATLGRWRKVPSCARRRQGDRPRSLRWRVPLALCRRRSWDLCPCTRPRWATPTSRCTRWSGVAVWCEWRAFRRRHDRPGWSRPSRSHRKRDTCCCCSMSSQCECSRWSAAVTTTTTLVETWRGSWGVRWSWTLRRATGRLRGRRTTQRSTWRWARAAFDTTSCCCWCCWHWCLCVHMKKLAVEPWAGRSVARCCAPADERRETLLNSCAWCSWWFDGFDDVVVSDRERNENKNEHYL